MTERVSASLVQPRVPDPGCPGPARVVQGSTIRADKTAVARGGFDMDVTATMGVGTAVGIEIASGPDVGHLSATGSFHWTSTSGAAAEENTNSRATARFDTYVWADYRHYLVEYLPCTGAPVWYQDELGEWTGGMGFGPLNYYSPGVCVNTPGAVDASIAPGGRRYKTTGSTYVLGAAASVYGISVRGESSQSSSYSMQWHAGLRYKVYTICGLDDQGLPSTALVDADT